MIKSIPLKSAVTCGLVAAFGFSGSLLAQQSTDDENELKLEEVVVTAQKREESLQDVAISITAISGADLERFAIRNFDDVVEMIPGLSSDSPNNGVNTRNIGIRGIITQSGSYLVGENVVGFYINNTPISAADPRLVDLERVEVLRGPQGTLYGASSLAGLIKYVTRKPSPDGFEGHAQGEISSTKDGGTGWDFQAAVNIPLGETFAIRASGYYEDAAGYIDGRPVDMFGFTVTGDDTKDINGIKRKGARIAAYWEPTENFRAHLSFMVNDLKSEAAGFTDNYAPDLSADGPVVLWRFPTEGNNDDDLTSLEIEWDLPSVQIQSTTSFFNQTRETNNLDVTNNFGLIANPAQISTGTYQLTRDEFTQEIRLFSTWDSKFNYILGGFYSKREQGYETRFPMIPGTTVFGFPNSPDGFVFWSSSTRLIKEKALFGQLTYDFTEQWSATVGARAFKFDTDLFDHFRGNPLFISGGDSILTGDSDADDIVPKFNVEFRPNDDVMIYASAAEGFRAGGSNFPLPATPACEADLLNRIGSPTSPLGYDPDGLWNYEIGTKTSLADGRITVNAALFQMDWDNIQVQVSPLCGLNGTVLNAGKARSKGFEYEMDMAVTDQLVIGLGIGYTDAKFTEDVSFGGSYIFASSGSKLPDVPKWTGNIRAIYNFPLTDTMEGFIRGTLSYRSERQTFPTIGTQDGRVKDAYELLNIRVGVNIQENWTALVFVENLTNAQPSFTGLPLPSFGTEIGGYPVDYTLRPRTIGASVRYDFR